MSVRYSGAGVGLLLGIVAACIILAVGLWAVIHWVSSDVRKDTGPIERIQTGTGRR